MDFYNHTRAFHPLDLEIMDRVYEAAWAAVKRATRFGISTRMASARSHYASWCSTTRARAGLISTSVRQVLANMPENWTMFTVRRHNAQGR